MVGTRVVFLLGALLLGACETGSLTEEGAAGPSPTPTVNVKHWAEPEGRYRFDVDAGCGDRGGLVGSYRISVVAGDVRRAVPLDRPTRAIPAAQALTIADLVARARAAAEEGVDIAKVSRDEQGVPTRIDIDRLLKAVDDEECYVISNVVTGETNRDQ